MGLHCFLDVDIGNTSASWRVIDADGVLERGVLEDPSDQKLVARLCEGHRLRAVRVASVAGEAWNKWLDLFSPRKIEVWGAKTLSTCKGFRIAYDNPEALGVDRWLAMLAVHGRGSSGVIVDIGTAVTVDVVNKDGLHIGGCILPGPELMLKSLHQHTHRLPKLSAEQISTDNFLGNNTADCMLAGVLASVMGVIHAQSKMHPDMPVWICGGYSKIWQSAFPSANFDPELIHDGLAIAWSEKNRSLG